jgi:hypothetical protein
MKITLADARRIALALAAGQRFNSVRRTSLLNQKAIYFSRFKTRLSALLRGNVGFIESNHKQFARPHFRRAAIRSRPRLREQSLHVL